ncbi:MAG: hypothetical protein N4A61_01475 [Pelagimonas sp.]|jgi:hypothetical protein|nr:hypothetical protein [Pelagimonas sp.]
MFRLIRFALILPVVFVAGMLFERNAHADRCLDLGGQVKSDLCRGWEN